jgi:hypothetical protein
MPHDLQHSVTLGDVGSFLTLAVPNRDQWNILATSNTHLESLILMAVGRDSGGQHCALFISYLLKVDQASHALLKQRTDQNWD